MDFVIIANPWQDGVANPTSKHQIAKELALKGHRVLWVNGSGMRRPSIENSSDRSRIVRKIAKAFSGVEKATDNIWVVSPLIFPFPQSSLAGLVNARIYLWIAQSATRHLEFKSPALMNFLPVLPEVVRQWRGVSVYCCVDLWSAFSIYHSATMADLDARCCKHADLVIASAGNLYDNCKTHGHNVHLISHGVDYQHFRNAVQDKDRTKNSRPADMPAGRIIGFFGLLSEWIDQELLVKLAWSLRDSKTVSEERRTQNKEPRTHIVLIGHVDADISRLEQEPNIHILGAKPFSDLPDYVAYFDVGIIPFVVNDLTKAVNPIKLKEMLAAGCPVVSTALPEVKQLRTAGRSVCVAEDYDEFVASVRKHVESPMSHEERKTISDSVKDETWASKVKTIIELVSVAKRECGR